MQRGEIWQLSIDRDFSLHLASRRAVILSSDSLAVLPLRVVVPLTDWQEDYISAPWVVRVPPVLNSGLERVMAADALQVRSVTTARLVGKIGDLPEKLVDQIAAAVDLVLSGPNQGI